MKENCVIIFTLSARMSFLTISSTYHRANFPSNLLDLLPGMFVHLSAVLQYAQLASKGKNILNPNFLRPRMSRQMVEIQSSITFFLDKRNIILKNICVFIYSTKAILFFNFLSEKKLDDLTYSSNSFAMKFHNLTFTGRNSFLLIS